MKTTLSTYERRVIFVTWLVCVLVGFDKSFLLGLVALAVGLVFIALVRAGKIGG